MSVRRVGVFLRFIYLTLEGSISKIRSTCVGIWRQPYSLGRLQVHGLQILRALEVSSKPS